jgi:hypothetical protein
MAEPKNVMDVSSMKALLLKSKQEPLSAAIGLGVDGGGKLLLHKVKGAMALGKQLESESPGLKDMRFGRAHVDVDDNPKLVKIVINRAVSGLSRRLVKTLKGSGFTKVILLLDDGTVVDRADEEEEEETHAGAASAPSDAPPPPPPPGPPPPPPPQAQRTTTPATPDAASLANLLKALVDPMRALIAASPERKEALLTLAAGAQAALKSGDLATATSQIRALRDALGPVPQSGATAGAPTGTGVTFQKMRLLWDSTRKNLHDQIKTLEAKVIEESDGAPNAEEIRANVTNLEVSLRTLDTSLSDALDTLYNAGGQDPKLKAKAKSIALRYQTFVATDPLMQDLDGNPFVQLDARARVDTTLAAVISHL